MNFFFLAFFCQIILSVNYLQQIVCFLLPNITYSSYFDALIKPVGSLKANIVQISPLDIITIVIHLPCTINSHFHRGKSEL